MSSRIIERSKEAEKEICDRHQGNKFDLEYFLIVSESEDRENLAKRAYGIEIVKRVCGVPSESKRFENIFTDRESMKDLIDIIAANTVTPVSLQYILDDLIGV